MRIKNKNCSMAEWGVHGEVSYITVFEMEERDIKEDLVIWFLF